MDTLAQIFREVQPKLYTFFYIKTSNFAIAEDLTQDVLKVKVRKHFYKP
ncbi:MULTISPECIES: hypothetical protein [unclassified Lysinibacillus]|nr:MULTISPECIES: hypothetical protein [unclassified Lysinibacillus]